MHPSPAPDAPTAWRDLPRTTGQPVTELWLARRLRDAGLQWEPREGDRFVITDRDMDDHIFTVASMVVEVRMLPGGPMISFNGTTEWALDSVLISEALWLPTESDLRREMDHRFVALRREADRWTADARIDGEVVAFTHPDAIGAVGVALLEVLRFGTGRD